MKALFWLLLIAFLGLLGYFLMDFAGRRRTQADNVSYEMSADSILAYRERAVELESRADSIRTKLGTIGLLARPAVRARVLQMDADIAALKAAIDNWQAAQPKSGGDNLYRRCILMYGKASGTCDALASDTLTPGR